jgi:hypothetical protein
MKKIVLVIAAAGCVLVGGAAAASAQTALSEGFRGDDGIGAVTGARDFVYGANHAPYGSNEDNSRDFQLQGTH